MATGRRVVGPGQVIGSDWGNKVWDQSVQTFTNAADRTTQFPSPSPGAMSYLENTQRLEVYAGGVWQGLGPNTFTNIGSIIWGTIDYAKPVNLVGGFIETAVNSASAFDIPLNTGAPWTCILSVTCTPGFKFNAAPYVNSIPMLNRTATVGTGTGGLLSVTMCNGSFVGIGNAVITGMAWTVWFQD